MEDGCIGESDNSVENFRTNIAGEIGFIAIDNVEETMSDEEDSSKVGLAAIIEEWEIEFGKSELIGVS